MSRKFNSVLLLAAGLLLGIKSASAELTEEGTGIPYGQGHAHFLTAPPGWMLDTDCGAGQGVYAAFYPKGSNWNGPVAAYSNANARDGRTDEQVIASDIADMRKNSPHLKVTDGGTIKTLDGKTALVRYFVNDVHGNSEVVAYVPEKDVVVNIVMSARNEPSFNLSLPAFRQLVSSYQWITGDPEHVDFVKLAHRMRPKAYHAKPESKTITRISCRLKGENVVPTTFLIYRAGGDDERVEIAKGSGKMHPSLIAKSPHTWMLSETGTSASHVLDKGPIMGTVFAIFSDFSSGPNSPLEGLEYGREVDFMRRYGVRNKDTWSASVDGAQVKLTLKPGSNQPLQLLATKKGKTETVEYLSYQIGLPYVPSLFQLPPNVKTTDAK